MVLIFFFGRDAIAQDLMPSQVPSIVKDALKTKFPNSNDIEWEKKGEYYNVEFEIGRNDHELWITPSGQIVKHKEEISSAQLPQNIKNKIKTDYKGYRIDDVDKLTIKDKVLYKVEIETRTKNNKKEVDLILDEDGKSFEKSAWYEMKF